MVISLMCSSVYAGNLQTEPISYEEFLHKVDAKEFTNIQEMKSYSGFISDFVSERFSDCEKGMWYEAAVGYLVGMGIIDGYNDGTFKPNNSIRVDEFITIIVKSLKYDLIETEGYWGATYIETAKENNLLSGLDITDFERFITRGEMAQIIANALGKDFEMTLNRYKKMIYDFTDIEDNQKEGILVAFSSGIITGGPDNTFKSNEEATRAEAATMIVRLLDEAERQVPQLESHVINGEIFTNPDIHKSEGVRLLDSTLHVDENDNIYGNNRDSDHLYFFSDSNGLEEKESNFSEILVNSNGKTYQIELDSRSGEVSVNSFVNGKSSLIYQLTNTPLKYYNDFEMTASDKGLFFLDTGNSSTESEKTATLRAYYSDGETKERTLAFDNKIKVIKGVTSNDNNIYLNILTSESDLHIDNRIIVVLDINTLEVKQKYYYNLSQLANFIYMQSNEDYIICKATLDDDGMFIFNLGDNGKILNYVENVLYQDTDDKIYSLVLKGDDVIVSGNEFGQEVIYRYSLIDKTKTYIYKQVNHVESIVGLREIAATNEYIYLLCGSIIKVYDKEMNFIQLIDNTIFNTEKVWKLYSYDDGILAPSWSNGFIMRIENNEIKWDESFNASLVYTHLAFNNYGDIMARRENYGKGMLASINIKNHSAKKLFTKDLSFDLTTHDFAYVDDLLFLAESEGIDVWTLDGEKITTIELRGDKHIDALIYSSYYDRIFVLEHNSLKVINPYTFEKEEIYSLAHLEEQLHNITVDSSGNFYAMDLHDTVYVMKADK